MGDILITGQELEYLTDIPRMVCEKTILLKPQKSFEEESQNCIIFEQFSRNINGAINRLRPNP